MKKYLSTEPTALHLFGITSLVLLPLTALGIATASAAFAWLALGLYLLVNGLAVYVVIRHRLQLKKQLADAEAQGILQQVQAEFADAVSLLDDEIRAGENWLYCRGTGFYRYADVAALVQQILRSQRRDGNGAERSRQLMFVLTDGTIAKVAKLPAGIPGSAAAEVAYDTLHEKNPAITLR